MKKQLPLVIMFAALSIAFLTVGCISGTETTDKNANENNLKFKLNEDQQSYAVVGVSSKGSESVVIPATFRQKPVTIIAARSFFGCRNMTSVIIPNSVVSIEKDAFSYCAGLKDIVVPDSVTNISENAFYYCSNLASIQLPFIGTSRDTSSTEPFSIILGSVPDSLETVTITGGSSIGDSAFSDCKNLKWINLPDTVVSIGKGAFSGCKNLKRIDLPDAVVSIGEDAFYGCRKLEHLSIPDNVTYIGSGAFWNCESLPELNLPNGLTQINDHTFYSMEKLESITIPDSVASIGEGAFSSCTSLTNVQFGKGLTSIGEEAFRRCSALTELTIPDSVTFMGKSAFEKCDNLKKMTIPYAGSVKDGTSDPLRENDYFFAYLFGGDVPGYSYKYVPKSLEEVIITGGKWIPANCFAHCYNIKRITLPDSLKVLCASAFDSCIGLTNIVIPEGTQKIRSFSFYRCASLQKITIPSSVTYIGSVAFESCINLSSIYYGGSKEQWKAIDKRDDWDKDTRGFTVYCQKE